MNGNLEPEERVMDDELIANRKSAAVMKALHDKIKETIATLGWDCYDNVTVEIGGTQVSGIDVGEVYNKKWQSPIGTRKYNKDAFIIIKNQDRRDLSKSEPFGDGEFKPQHPYTPPSEDQEIVVNMDGGVGGSWEVKEES
jgi:hypothetical protein|tara:strand:- start:11071 stop:11490 length:420 start_codon:yes stop_codon:yes gene_type:complete